MTWGDLGNDPRVVYQDESVILLCARWQDVDLPGVDAVITDPPYSERTHGAYREMELVGRAPIGYAPIGEPECVAAAQAWADAERARRLAPLDSLRARFSGRAGRRIRLPAYGTPLGLLHHPTCGRPSGAGNARWRRGIL